MSDPAKYRSKEEVDSYKSNDPLDIISKEIIKRKFLTKKQLEKINKDVIQEIKEAAEFALDSPPPSDEDLYTNVYI